MPYPATPSGSNRLPPPRRVALIAAAIVAAGVVAFGTSVRRGIAPARIVRAPNLPAAAHPIETAPYNRESWVSPAGFTASAHSCATCVLPNGDLLAVWFGGSREGAADVALFTARYQMQKSAWTAPAMVVDRESAQDELGRLIKKVGNAAVFPDRNGTLWLVYVTVTFGGWSGSALNVKSSQDEGRTWTDSERLSVNPLFNLSSLVRNKPIYADDGRIGLPVYHEMALTYPQMLWLAPQPDGQLPHHFVRSAAGAEGLIQPVVIQLANNRVAMLLRDHTDERRLRTAFSDDNGWTWSKPQAGALPNPDSAVDALRLRDGRILLVYNDSAKGRENLRLAVSEDDGTSWTPGPTIEAEASQEFSYPCLTEDQRGRIHLTYTWKRQRIKHVAFNVAWLGQALGQAAEVP